MTLGNGLQIKPLNPLRPLVKAQILNGFERTQMEIREKSKSTAGLRLIFLLQTEAEAARPQQ